MQREGERDEEKRYNCIEVWRREHLFRRGERKKKNTRTKRYSNQFSRKEDEIN